MFEEELEIVEEDSEVVEEDLEDDVCKQACKLVSTNKVYILLLQMNLTC